MTVRVILADDQPLVRAGLRMLIEQIPDIDVAGEAGTGAEAVQHAGKEAGTQSRRPPADLSPPSSPLGPAKSAKVEWNPGRGFMAGTVGAWRAA
jgi:hypothetical protein